MNRIREIEALVQMAINRVMEEKRARTRDSLYCRELDGLLDLLDSAATAIEQELEPLS